MKYRLSSRFSGLHSWKLVAPLLAILLIESGGQLMENATKTASCDDASRANFADRLLSRALTERRRPDTLTGRIFGTFAKNDKAKTKVEDDKVLAGAG